MANIETKIISSLVYRKEFYEKTISYLKDDYFKEESYKIVLNLIKTHYDSYDSSPTKESLLISLEDVKLNNQQTYTESKAVISSITEPSEDMDWLSDKTEQFCKDRAIHKAILDVVGIYDGENKKHSYQEIPELLEKAISVSFENRIGHDYIDELDRRYDIYTRQEERLEFDIDLFNVVTNGGLKKKTLNLLVASTGGCKSLVLCHCAASFLMAGKNVIYFTLEMAEEAIAERIDSNLLDIKINALKYLSREQYKKKFHEVLNRTSGKLVIKEYPTGDAHAHDFKHFINELKIKKNFVPDVIVVDYLTICSSYKAAKATDGYSKNKAVAEELRGLSMVYNVPLLSAVQLNRAGSSSSEPSLTDIGESFGIAQTADLALCLVSNEELEENEQLMVIQLKNRYNTLNKPKKFRIGVDKQKMKIYNLEDSAVVGQINTQSNVQVPEPNFDFDLNPTENVLNANFNFGDE